MSQLKPTLILLMAVGVFISSSVFAIVEASLLKIDGKKVDAFGPSACTKTADVEIELPPKVLQDHNQFYAMFVDLPKKTDAKAKAESACDASVSDSNRLKEQFAKGDAKLAVKKFMPDVACGKDGDSGERALCIYANYGKELVSFARFAYGTSVAKIENITDKDGANGQVTFTVQYKGGTAATGAPQFVTCYGKAADGNINEDTCPQNFFLKTSPTSDVVIAGLENDVEYSFKVRIVQGIEETPWSTPFNIKPVRVASPLSAYDGEGSKIQFSCQQTSTSSTWMLLFFLLGLLLLRLRHLGSSKLLPLSSSTKPVFSTRTCPKKLINNSHNFLLMISFFSLINLVLPTTSHSEPGQVNVGLLGAMYRPDLDSEVTASGKNIFPFYKCFFRKKTSEQNGPINPLLGFEVDMHLWDRFGSLQLGLGLGYTFTRGRDLKYNAVGEPDCENPNESSKVSLHMYQLRPQLTYLFNPFADIIPIIPYARVSLIGQGYSFFRGTKSETSHKNASGVLVKPHGIVIGYSFAVGGMVMLDFLERSAINTARGQGFLEHVYLKAELSYTKIDNFGSRGFQFSAKDVMGTSLPLMWTFGLVFELP